MSLDRIVTNTSKIGHAERLTKLLDEQMEIKEMSPALPNLLIVEIHVYQKERLEWHYHQMIDIYYIFVSRKESTKRMVSQAKQVA